MPTPVKSNAGWLIRSVLTQISHFEREGYNPNNGLLDKLVVEARHLEEMSSQALTRGFSAPELMDLAAAHYKWFLLVQYYCLTRDITHEEFTEILAARGVTNVPV